MNDETPREGLIKEIRRTILGVAKTVFLLVFLAILAAMFISLALGATSEEQVRAVILVSAEYFGFLILFFASMYFAVPYVIKSHEGEENEIRKGKG